MILKLWETIFGYFKDKPYWAKVQPFFTLVALYIISQMLAYQFIEWRYRFSLSLALYFGSYIFKQITLVFVTIGIIGFIFSHQGKSGEEAEQNPFKKFARQYAHIVLKRAAIIGLVMAVVAPVFLYFSPNKVSHIRIEFLTETEPDFDKYALAYLIYELNKQQKNWYFEVDFDVFDESALTTKEREKCAGEDKTGKSLCYAEIMARGQGFIGITTEKLGEDYFWQSSNQVSVISTFRWQDYAPPSTYEFLVYSIIVQSIVIHLSAHCGGLPENAFKESRVAYGDLFQFSPRRQAMKATILAAHLSRKGEELLLNCFGVEYMSTCSNLLRLEWLHAKQVTENLEKSFGVKL